MRASRARCSALRGLVAQRRGHRVGACQLVVDARHARPERRWLHVVKPRVAAQGRDAADAPIWPLALRSACRAPRADLRVRRGASRVRAPRLRRGQHAPHACRRRASRPATSSTSWWSRQEPTRTAPAAALAGRRCLRPAGGRRDAGRPRGQRREIYQARPREARVPVVCRARSGGSVVGSACCQVTPTSAGLEQRVVARAHQDWRVWNLVRGAPEYRERGVEAKLLERVVGLWKETTSASLGRCRRRRGGARAAGLHAAERDGGRARPRVEPVLDDRSATRRGGAAAYSDARDGDVARGRPLTHEELSFNASGRKSGAELA